MTVSKPCWTSSAFFTPTSTPLASVLCRISGETILSTTGKPIAVAIAAASAADVATPSFGTVSPYASQTSLPSGAVSAVRPSALTVSSTRLTSVRLLIIVVPRAFRFVSDDVVGAQSCDLIRAEAEFCQDLVGVLAEQWRSLHVGRTVRHLDR